MTAHFQPTGSVANHLAALDRGCNLALSQKGERASARDAIWFALSDALEVIEGGPDHEKALRKLRSSAGTWSRAGLTIHEAKELAKVRIMSGLHPTLGSTMVRRTNEADRAMLTLEWMRFLDRFPDALALHKASVEILKGDKRNKACSIWRPGRQHSRQTVHEIRRKCIDGIVAGLAGLGIVAGHGCAWVSIGD